MKSKAVIISRDKYKKQVPAEIREIDFGELGENEVQIEVEYSSLNFKDALAITGKGKIIRRYPLVPGVDLCGTIRESNSQKFNVGDPVLVTGCGLGETIHGGYSKFAQVPDSIVVAIPKGLTAKETMILGTAGFTAALCLERMLTNNQSPGMGPILVTGASGGVGSVAIQVFSQAGFTLHAVSGREELFEFLRDLGAEKVISHKELNLGSSPLESVRYGGAIDNLGGDTLSGIIRHTQLWGNIACVGLAESPNFSGTVMPHILRGVSLLGISSANCPMPLRQKVWQMLATDWKPKSLEKIHTSTISPQELIESSEKLLSRQIHGRILVECSSLG